MKNKTTKTIACVIAGLTLTACGSGSGITGIDSNENAMPSITDRVASQSRVGTFSGGSNPDDNADDVVNETNIETEDIFNLRIGNRTVNQETLIMTINGVNYTLESVPTDVQGVENSANWVNDSNAILVNGYRGGIIEIIDGIHPTIQGDYVLFVTDTPASSATSVPFDYRDGYATIGIQSDASVVTDQQAKAIYTGDIAIRINQNKIVGSRSDITNSLLFGDIEMNVDFDANTISGTAMLARYDDDGPNTEPPTKIANFASTPIIGNGFDGTFTLGSDIRADAGLTDNPTGTYAGNFFGTNADDLAGVIELNGTNANGAVIGYGGFRGDRQTSE